jgi:hypothetical protein
VRRAAEAKSWGFMLTMMLLLFGVCFRLFDDDLET